MMGQVHVGQTRLEPFMRAQKIAADGTRGPVIEADVRLPWSRRAWLAIGNACMAVGRALGSLSRKV